MSDKEYSDIYYISCRFLDGEGNPKGNAYTYGARVMLQNGEVVYAPNGKRLVVVNDHAPAIAEEYADKLKFVTDEPPADSSTATGDIGNGDGITRDEISQVRLSETGGSSETGLAVLSPAADATIDYKKLFDRAVIVEQLPVITQNLTAISDEIDRRVSAWLALPVSEAAVKEVKAARAALNKERTAFEDLRKGIKRAINEPYVELEKAYDANVGDKYDAAYNALTDKINAVENATKDKKRVELVRYFTEYAESVSLGGFLRFDMYPVKVGLSDTETALKKSAKSWIDSVKSDTEAIKSSNDSLKLYAEYKSNGLNLAAAIAAVADRRKREEQAAVDAAERAVKEAARVETAAKVAAAVEETSAALEPPKPVKTPYDFSFTVHGEFEGKPEMRRFWDWLKDSLHREWGFEIEQIK